MADLSGELEARSFEEGVGLFNKGRFWEAHEAWERLWLASSGPDKRFLQGLIQLAAAYHHIQRGTLSGGIRLFEAAAEKLKTFPDGYHGIDRAGAMHRAEIHRGRAQLGEKIDPFEYPKLRYNRDLSSTRRTPHAPRG